MADDFDNVQPPEGYDNIEPVEGDVAIEVDEGIARLTGSSLDYEEIEAHPDMEEDEPLSVPSDEYDRD